MSTREPIIKIATSLNLAVLLLLIINEWSPHIVNQNIILDKEQNVSERSSEAQAQYPGLARQQAQETAEELARLQSVAQASAKEIAKLRENEMQMTNSIIKYDRGML